MKCNRIRLAVSVGVLSLLLHSTTSGRVYAQGGENNDLDAINKQLKKLTDDLAGDFKAVAKDIAEIRQNLKTIKDSRTTLELGLAKALERIETLEQTVGKLSTLQVANKPPPDQENGGKKPVKPDQPAPFPPVGGGDGNGKDAGDKMAAVLDRLGKLEQEVVNLRAEIKDLKKRTSYYPPQDLGLDIIKKRLGEVEKELTRMQSGPPRIARSSPTAGRIYLMNLSSELMLFIVNGVTHRVNPGSSRLLTEYPAGAITYEVISSTGGLSSGETLSRLAPGETLTLTATR